MNQPGDDPQTERPASQQTFTEQLSTLHQINLELSRATSIDEICRRAVIFWRDQLQFDRIGIWLVCDTKPNYLCGSFGIDEKGQVRDERSQSIENDAPIFLEILNNQKRVYYNLNQPLLNDRSQPVGYGESAAAALWDGQTVIGFVVTDNLISQHPLSNSQRDILYLFGQVLGHVISQKRAEATIKENERRHRLLNEITQAAIRETSFSKMLQILVERFAALLQINRCSLVLWDENEQKMTAGAKFGPVLFSTPIEEQISQIRAALKSGNPQVADRLYAYPNTAACLVLPLIADQQPLGSILIEADQPEIFTKTKIALGEAASRQIALAILKTQLFTQTQQRLKETETLRAAGIAVAAALKQDEAIERILEELNRVVPYDSATVQLRREDDMEIVGVRGFTLNENFIGMRFPVTQDSPNKIVIEQKLPYILNDAPAKYPAFLHGVHKQVRVRGWMGVPILLQDHVIGMLTLDSQQPGKFTQAHARMATAFAAHVAITLENTRLFNEVQRLATHDYLTGIYNRRYFMEQARQTFERACRYDENMSVLMIDVDHFKSVNDTYGHQAGDQVLQHIAQTCLKQLRNTDLMGRYGGEEFIILLPQTTLQKTEPEHERYPALQTAERLRKAIDELVIQTGRGEINPTISLGIAERTEEHTEFEQIIELADLALLESKTAGRNRITIGSMK
jgi:diguanylate cyclase (GGDEF)-like protein